MSQRGKPYAHYWNSDGGNYEENVDTHLMLPELAGLAC